MGTRAAFFIGDPRDVDNREWLGCIAWDGYPDGDCARLAEATDAEHFRALVKSLAIERDDFASPEGGFPFPWMNDLFLTDCVYAFFDGDTHVDVNRNWRTVRWCLEASDEERIDALESSRDPSFENVPAPGGDYDPTQPDSIMVIRA